MKRAKKASSVTRNTPFEELPEWLTLEEYCTWLSLGKSAVYQHVKSGEIKSRAIGRLIRIPKESIRAWIDTDRELEESIETFWQELGDGADKKDPIT